MHPLKYFFEDIYRAWGLPGPDRRKVHERDAPAWQRSGAAKKRR